MDVVFQAQKWALSPDIPNQGSKVLLFDILLEENVLGIPVSALPLVITAVVVVAVCWLRFISFWELHYFYVLMRQVTSP